DETARERGRTERRGAQHRRSRRAASERPGGRETRAGHGAGDPRARDDDRGDVDRSGRGEALPFEGVREQLPVGPLDQRGGESGKNLAAHEADEEIVVVVAALAFPRDEHLGVDLILPDFSYLAERVDRIRALLLTHAHEDHVGALPYLLREVRIPEIWGTRL